MCTQISLDAVDQELLPRTIISVQSSYKLHLPPYLLIHSANIKLAEPIGQGAKQICHESYHYAYHIYYVLLIIILLALIVGEFGIVYKGYIIVKEQGSIVTDIVAVKTLKGDGLY